MLGQIDIPIDIIIGDLNIKWKTATGAESRAQKPRRQALETFFDKNKLLYNKPDNMIIHIDHCFSHKTIEMKQFYFIENAKKTFKSDHAGQSIHLFNTAPERTIQRQQAQNRYKIFKLQKEFIQDRLITSYEEQSAVIETCITEFDQTHDIELLQSLIEKTIHNSCTEVLGTYSEKDLKQQRKTRYDNTFKQYNLKEVDKFFNRATSRNASTTIVTPLDECIKYQEGLYKHDPSYIEEPFNEPETPTAQHRDHDDLLFFINEERLGTVIRGYDSSKACGPENIPTKALQILFRNSTKFRKHLTFLFNRIAYYGVTPTKWNQSRITCIPKVFNKKKLTIEEVRGIALTSIFRRFFEILVIQYIEKSNKEWTHIHPNQSGFRRKVDTYPNIILCHDSHRFKRIIKCFIDLKAAYDKVPIKRLLAILRARGCPEHLILLIKNMFVNTSSILTVNNQSTAAFTRETGIFQGSILSPFLFNIFIDELAKELEQISHEFEATATNTEDNTEKRAEQSMITNMWSCSHCDFVSSSKGGITQHINRNQCHENQRLGKTRPEQQQTQSIQANKKFPYFLLYADDIVINGENLAQVQKLLTCIQEWCKKNNMTPGIKKCQWVADSSVQGSLTINDTALERVESYKYLGVPMTAKGVDFVDYMRQRAKAIECQMGLLQSIKYYLPTPYRIRLIKSQILSKIEYCLPLFKHWQTIQKHDTSITPTEKKAIKEESKKVQERIKKVLRECRIFSKVKPSGDLGKFLTNIQDLEDIMSERSAGLAYRLDRNLPEDHPFKKLQHVLTLVSSETLQQSMTYQSTQSETYKEYTTEKPKMSIKRYIKKKKRKKTMQKMPTACYTLPDNNRNSQTDLIYRIRDADTFGKALNWRQNSVGFFDPNLKDDSLRVKDCVCKVCHVPFKRGHVNTCPVVRNNSTITADKWKRFRKNTTKVQALNKEAKHYTILDDLLNHFEIKLFKKVYESVQNHLEYSYTPKRVSQPSNVQDDVTTIGSQSAADESLGDSLGGE